MNLKRKDQGVAGLTILLSVVAMLFAIGIIVMVFALMGGELQDTSLERSDAPIQVVNETTSAVSNTSEEYFSKSNWTDSLIESTIICYNGTTGDLITTDNYTVDTSACSVISTEVKCDGVFGVACEATDCFHCGYDWVCTYNYTYRENTSASDTILATTKSISGVSDWFPIIIVLSAMVVLILLTVIIISAVKGITRESESA